MRSKFRENAARVIVQAKQNICRLCLKEESAFEFVNAHDEQYIENENCCSTTTLLNILHSITKMNIDIEELPHKFCDDCCRQLLNHYLFSMNCLNQEKFFNELVEQIGHTNNMKDIKSCNEDLHDQSVNDEFDRYSDDFTINLNPKCLEQLTNSDQAISSERELHKSCTEIVNPKLFCKACKITFSSKKLLKQHRYLKQCKINMKQCLLCMEMFPSRKLLMAHMKSDHGGHVFICSECPSKFTNSNLLKQHLRRTHLKSFICKTCGKIFGSRNILKLHEESHTEKICDQCGATYKSTKTLQRHSLICKQLLALKDFKKFHLSPTPQTHKLYGIDRKYTCDYCKTEYQQKESLAYHIKKQHLFPGSYKCEKCSKRFNLSRNLKVHEKVHMGNKTERCNVCFQYFVNKMALKYHLRLHSGEKPYACTICQESFLSSSRRMFHMRKKHWGPQLECTFCLKKYHTPYDLKKHTVRHSNPNSRLFINNELNNPVTEPLSNELNNCVTQAFNNS